MARCLSAFGLAIRELWSEAPLDGGRFDPLPGIALDRLRMAIAAAAAAPAASSAVPASTFGQRLVCGTGGSSFRAAVASTDETLGARCSCTEMLPRAALTAIQARTRPTLGLAQVVVIPAPRRAVIVAFFDIGRA